MPMFPIRQWGVMIVVGIVVVLLLSRIPSLEQALQERRQTVAVFQPSQAKWLTDDNMVDRLARLPLQDRLVKVGWDHAILTIDMQGAIPEEVWADIGRLIIFPIRKSIMSNKCLLGCSRKPRVAVCCLRRRPERPIGRIKN
ncbi:hypothetical protein [Cohnella cholangitidis]|uniref:Uncharacterized protein n=1 Tax=Cohnella cholangitidis TaxID=2598458 RepID=A0A7G5C588_9BACL|nr:hypothetical protein [Cohnella cholangitidis]QMV44372.1 hypothetical protein FPL14_26805 [Cohnella cholangitidis]